MDSIKINHYKVGKILDGGPLPVASIEIVTTANSVTVLYNYPDNSYNLYQGKGYI